MTTAAIVADPASLIAALREPARYPHPVTRVEVLETHISWVILTGRHAYKIKKPVNLGFVDFSTLQSRRRYCEEELRLNRRLAPSVYEAVVPITGSVDDPRIDGVGAAIEYAVRMREFAQSALASCLLTDGALDDAQIDRLAARIAAFHAESGIAASGCPYGTPEAVIKPAQDNFTQLARLLPAPADQARLAELQAWTDREYHERWTLFGERHASGSVRECHGDLHLGNIVLLEGELTPFDCLEFDPALRWIDVMSEVAFLVMDLTDRGRADFATRFLNAYLEASGEYAGLPVLRFYLVYRAMVRAKVHALRATQPALVSTERDRLHSASQGYILLAQRYAHAKRPAIILMHGLSGSGKSVIAESLAQNLGAIRLRSDVERKRIAGLAPQARSGSALASGLYTAEQTRATYQRLLDLARIGVGAGFNVIVDATFLQRWQRELFRREAATHNMAFFIVDVTAAEATLRARIAARLAASGDASEADPAVLPHQLAACEALTDEESASAVRIDTERTDVQTSARTVCAELCARLAVVTSIDRDQGGPAVQV